MHRSDKYWLMTLGRGILALLASSSIVLFSPILNSQTKSLILFPFLLGVAVLFMSMYGLLDSALVIAAGAVLPKSRYAHWALLMQGAIGAVIIVLVAFQPDRLMHLQTAVMLAAMQALCTAAADALTAVHARDHQQGTGWLVVCSGISLVSAAVLLLGRTLAMLHLAQLICGYLFVLGASFLLLSIHMLLREGHIFRQLLRRARGSKDGPAAAIPVMNAVQR